MLGRQEWLISAVMPFRRIRYEELLDALGSLTTTFVLPVLPTSLTVPMLVLLPTATPLLALKQKEPRNVATTR